MSKMKPNTPFDGYERDFGGLNLKEASGFEIVSIAIANGETASFSQTLKKSLGATLPEPGSWTETNNGKLLWTGQNQYFLFNSTIDDCLDETLSTQFGETAYCTLQTDGWAALDCSGDNIHDVLERFVPLDLRQKETGFGARTSAHHMSLIILKTGPNNYRMLTSRSSSAAFLEAFEHVIENVI